MWWDQIGAEWVKVRSVRSLLVLPVAAACVAPGVAVLVGTTGSLAPEDTVVGGALTGSVLGLVVIGVWGALLMTSEYSSGTIRATVAATPRRMLLPAAKAAVAATIGAVVGVVASATAVLIGSALLSDSVRSSGRLVHAVLGVGLCYPVLACLGVAVGALLRGSVAAVGVIVAVAVLPGLLGPLLGDLGPWVSGVGPAAVAAKFAQSSDAGAAAVGSLGPVGSLAVLCAYTVAVCVPALWLFEIRDV